MSKKNKWIIAIIVLFIVIGIGLITPVIVHSFSPGILSEITADGMLGYIIGYLSFITTGILALYALFQTKQSNDIAQKYNDMTSQLLKIEKINYKLQIRPFITITNYEIIKYTQSEIINSENKVFIIVGEWDLFSDSYGITLRITNTTGSFLSFSYSKAVPGDVTIMWKNSMVDKNIKNSRISLLPGESKEVVFIADDEFILNHSGKSVELYFTLANRFAEIYEESFKTIFAAITKNNDSLKGYLFFQDFHIYRMEKKDGQFIPIEEEL